MDAGQPLPRSALIMPIYEEDAEHVFAGLAAMRESLAHTPGGQAFEIFILSDSRRPEQVAEEERAFRRVARLALPIEIPIFYRRRVLNERQKAGNLSEFFERFGHRYEYAVVLDADSLMRADTLVTMLRRMEAAPQLALLQAPLELHRGATIFARTQQLAASVCGPLFTRGLAYLSGATGNYYGHNAAIRTKAFLECCSLPVLDGQPPLGGHILSHDFVEAALLCRAGWEVRIAHDLGGSWEELPATLPDYVARDRRWCQGNLQHLRVALAQGFKPMSRMHMWVGAGAYLAGPAWLCFTVLGAVLAATTDHALVPAAIALPIMLATAAMLLGPRLFGVIATLAQRTRRVAHGGAFFVILSGLCELLLGSLLAPLMMIHHTRIVLAILTGSSIRWGAQNRRASGGMYAQIARSELMATFLGIAAASSLQLFAPQLLLWLAPIWLPLVLAIPLAMLVSSSGVGALVARIGVFTTPSETDPDDLLLRADDFRALTKADKVAQFRDLVLDPLLLTAQLRRLRDAEQPARPAAERDALAALLKRALRVGPAALTESERASLAQDAESLRSLHREAWRHWPVESWQLARHVPQLPTDDETPPLRASLPSMVPACPPVRNA
jgi:membrane glycosyltransferase